MGILDSKSRIMDVVITQEGKRQLASGQFRAEYASFSDAKTFYEYDAASGSYEATNRIYFENPINLPQDIIALESDDSGRLINFNNTPKLTLFGNQIFTTGSVSGSNITTLTSGSNFSSLGQEVISTIFSNFKNNQLLATKEDNVNQQFTLSTENIAFTMTNDRPFLLGPKREVINLNSIEPLFIDKRLSHLPNFKFLPPDNGDGNPLGTYDNLNQKPPNDYQDFLNEIGTEKQEEAKSYSDDPFDQVRIQELLNNDFTEGNLKPFRERISIDFKSNSAESNLLMQMFEVADNKIVKLDVIDFGQFVDENDFRRPIKQIFFVGKIFIDNYGYPTFVNMFDIIMD